MIENNNKDNAWSQLVTDLLVEKEGYESIRERIVDLVAIAFEWGWTHGYNQAMLDYNVEEELVNEETSN